MTPEVLSCVFLFAWLLEIIEIVSVIVLIYNLRTSKKCSECSRNGIETPSETVQDSPMVLHCYDDIILDAFYPEPRISQTEDKPDADCNSDTVVTATRRPLVPPMVLNDAILDATEPAVPDESTIPQPKSLEVDGKTTAYQTHPNTIILLFCIHSAATRQVSPCSTSNYISTGEYICTTDKTRQ